MGAAFSWKSAWETADDDIEPEETHCYPRYTLPGDNTHIIYEGDQFWDSKRRVLIEVMSVKTKIYQGVVGYKGEEGEDCVFWTPDYTRPVPKHTRHRREIKRERRKPNYNSAEVFASKIEKGLLVPHTGNGPPPRP